MNWEAFHHRGDVLRAVTTELDARRDGTLPVDVPGVDATFHDELDLLAALMLRWTSRLTGHIERELAAQPVDLEAAVVDAWRAAGAELPGIRAAIDRHRAEPHDEAMAAALARAARKERSMLAVMAGRVSTLDVDDHAVRIGTAIEDRARLRCEPPVPEPRVRGRHAADFLDRLKAALAA
jgi:hypothetical protein